VFSLSDLYSVRVDSSKLLGSLGAEHQVLLHLGRHRLWYVGLSVHLLVKRHYPSYTWLIIQACSTAREQRGFTCSA